MSELFECDMCHLKTEMRYRVIRVMPEHGVKVVPYSCSTGAPHFDVCSIRCAVNGVELFLVTKKVEDRRK